MMQRQMLMMQEMQQSTLSAGMGMNMGVPAAVQPPPSAAKRAGATGGRKARQSSQFPMVSAANQLTQHNHNQDREMTFEEKSSLSSSINKLTSNNLGRVRVRPAEHARQHASPLMWHERRFAQQWNC
eukprot:1506123-Pleurochrysis_carterae.AAC.3